MRFVLLGKILKESKIYRSMPRRSVVPLFVVLPHNLYIWRLFQNVSFESPGSPGRPPLKNVCFADRETEVPGGKPRGPAKGQMGFAWGFMAVSK
jgi:hypothetical protein